MLCSEVKLVRKQFGFWREMFGLFNLQFRKLGSATPAHPQLWEATYGPEFSPLNFSLTPQNVLQSAISDKCIICEMCSKFFGTESMWGLTLHEVPTPWGKTYLSDIKDAFHNSWTLCFLINDIHGYTLHNIVMLCYYSCVHCVFF